MNKTNINKTKTHVNKMNTFNLYYFTQKIVAKLYTGNALLRLKIMHFP